MRTAMSNKHAKLIEAIFRDPVNTNIHFREIEALLSHLGARIDAHAGARLHVWLNGQDDVLHRPHRGNTLGRQDIKHLREFLARARCTPSQYQEALQQKARGS